LLLTAGEKIFLERSVRNSFFRGSEATSDGMNPRSTSMQFSLGLEAQLVILVVMIFSSRFS
jgi:hypothetical protein